MRKFSPFAVLAIVLMTFTAAIAAYTGPIRPRDVSVSTGWVRTICDNYRTAPYNAVCGNNPVECQCGLETTHWTCSDNPTYCRPQDYPSPRYSIYESESFRTERHNPATASGSFTCSTWGSSGWCRGGASLNVSGSEPVSGYSISRMEGNYDNSNNAAVSCNGSSCSFTPPQGQGTFWYWAVSTYGDTSAKYSMTYKHDSGAPSVSLSPSGTLGANGWYRSNVTVSGSGSDAVSGLAGVSLSCGSNPCTITADGTHTITATATDNAGNTASTSVTIRKDTTPPTIAFSPSGTAGNSGWWRSSVTLSASGSDAHSGLSSLSLSCGSNPCTLSAQGANTVTATAGDAAGNTASSSTTIYIDSVPPNASLSPSGTLGSNGWYVSNVTVTTGGSDATSGVASVQTRLNGGAWGGNSVTITTDGVHTVEGQSTDVAGNTSSVVSTTIRRDTVPPTASLNIPTPNGSNGWFVTNPTVSTGGSDAASGIAASQVRVNGGAWQSSAVVSGDGTHTVEGRAQDNAGHWSSTVSATVRVDTTPPTANASLPAPNGQNGWYVSPVTVTAQGDDATSGIASREVRLGSGAWQANSLTVSTDGTHTVTVRTTDNAGLTNTATVNVPYDATPPVISGLDVSGTAGNNGWYRSNVDVAGLAADATSGIALVQVNGQPNLSLSDGVHSVTVRAVDQAGNESTQTITVRVDTTPPDLTPQIDTPSGQNGWHVAAVQVDASADDATSGVESVRVRINGGSPQSLPLTLDQDGIYTIEYEAVDLAGNLTTRTETVRVDTTPPSANVISPAVTGNNGWYIDNPSLTVDASDNLSGVQSRLIRVGSGTWQAPPLELPEGVHTVQVMAVDEAGNPSAVSAYTFLVDLTPPGLSPEPSTPDGSNGWYREEAVVQAAADDNLSGLADVRVRVDGGTWQSLPLTLTDEGVYEVEIQAEDEAGHITSRSLTISIDRTAPTITPDLPAPDGKNGWFVSPFDVDYTTTDNLSGVEETQWRLNGGDWQNATPQVDGEGEIILDIRSQDTAGNERIRRYTFSLDQTLPTGEIALTGEAGVEEWYRSPVEAVLTGTDAVSGVAETRILGVNTQQNGEVSLQFVDQIISTEGWHTLTGEVEDNAGWVREVSRSFGIDLTLPQGSFDQLPELLSGTVELTGEAKDLLSGLQKAEISFSMGYQWQELPVTLDRWSFQWDTTQTGGGYRRIYLRLTDKAGNTYTASVNVLVSNALPQAAVTESWTIDQSGIVSITPGDLPIRRVCLTIQDPADETRKVEWCGESVESIPNPVRWDGKFADGTIAGPGQYRVTVLVTDIANRTATASGTVIIPAPTATPTIPPVIPESGGNTPTRLPLLPTATPTPTMTPTETLTQEPQAEPTQTPPAVSMVLPTPQPTLAFKPPKYEFQAQAAVEVVRRALWPFLTLLGLAAALGYSAVRDERPRAIRKLAERMETIIQFKQEVK
ncbi:MAG: Ig-like domain-containing protein [Chloroflexota bacterium]